MFVRLFACVYVCVHVGLHVCIPKTDAISTHMGHPIGAKSIPKSTHGPPKGLRNRPRADQNRSKIAPWGSFGGSLGRSWDFVRNGCLQHSTGDLGKATFWTSKGPKGAQRAPKAIYRPDPAPPKTPLGRFLFSQNAERKNKKMRSLLGPLGPDVRSP